MNADRFSLSVLQHRLDQAIRCEARRPIPDEWGILRLKKLRLAIKDLLTCPMGGRDRGKLRFNLRYPPSTRSSNSPNASVEA
ncbi:YdcH family protein [Sphingomonas sp. S1-29]|uniref:YdcH family protein n=1 Tax=Sphingomonas sp. S1-29 TaxID=2991074 RepID=UPI00223FDE94|nr:YdcH family protein [Sphingomonas sp. S1-29]